MLKVKSGDLDKMGLLFERYSRPLYGFLFHMTNKKEASEDMVQIVFYRMLKYRNTFTGEGEFETWMYHLARNVLKDEAKRWGKYSYHEDLDDHTAHVASSERADDHLEREQSTNELNLAMSKLSGADREILVLARFQELKYHEIAQVLKISVGAVKVRVFRAMQQLKNIYARCN